jgi:hypothetical protein
MVNALVAVTFEAHGPFLTEHISLDTLGQKVNNNTRGTDNV